MSTRASTASPDSGSTDDLEVVRRIVLSGLRGHPARVFLFGSRARGDARRTSDIDVAILPEGPIPDGLLARIRDELEESLVPFAVDLVDLRDAPTGLRERALQEGTEWTACAKG